MAVIVDAGALIAFESANPVVLAPRIGSILAAASRTDLVDGSLVEIASVGDEILTTDPDEIAHLASAAGRRLVIIAISA